jgi:hypothetical protein
MLLAVLKGEPFELALQGFIVANRTAFGRDFHERPRRLCVIGFAGHGASVSLCRRINAATDDQNFTSARHARTWPEHPRDFVLPPTKETRGWSAFADHDNKYKERR